MNEPDFIPRWASPPSDTLKEALSERSLRREILPQALDLTNERIQALMEGDLPLTIDLADRLTTLIGGSVEFWITRDAQYRLDLARSTADSWARRFPISDMSAFGWIPARIDNWISQIDACLEFFDVKDPEEWKAGEKALQSHARFRSSSAPNKDDYAVAAWLRQSQLELSKIECGSWDREAFAEALPELLPLTRNPNPNKFLPRLAERCADVGVAVGVIRAPRGCPISGAARQLKHGQPAIALTGRYLADDHLWFTFFHEAAHLVLHDSDTMYIDAIERGSESALNDEETEADRYAGSILVPPEYEQVVADARHNPIRLRSLARDIGVSTGILVGNLQHRGLLGYSTKLNKLKTRYRWNGPNLERA